MESVLITGAARRLGSLIAEDLASTGCFVWIHYHSHEQDAFTLKERIIRNGGQADCVYANLTETTQIDAMLQNITSAQQAPPLTTLINNASIFLPGTIQSATAEDWDTVVNVNLRAIWYLSTRFAEKFSTAKRIISIGDASVSNGYAQHALYGLSKAALPYLTEQMAAAFAPGISANLLSPGFVFRGENEPETIWNQRMSRTLLDNSNITDSVLKGIRFLMSDPGMTGAELRIDNGLQIHCKNSNLM